MIVLELGVRVKVRVRFIRVMVTKRWVRNAGYEKVRVRIVWKQSALCRRRCTLNSFSLLLTANECA